MQKMMPFTWSSGLICGFIAVFVTLQVRKRSRLVRAGFFVGLATWLLALTFGLIKVQWDAFPDIDWSMARAGRAWPPSAAES